MFKPYYQLLKTNTNFRYLWLSQAVSLFGDWFNLIASAALISQLTASSGMAISGLFIARLLPPFLLGPFVGVVADRFNRRTILITSDILRGFIVFNFLLIQSETQIWLLYLLTVLQLSVSAFFEPTRAAILPSLVNRHELITANTLSSITWSLMLAVGAAMGGITTALFGITTAFVLDILTFFFSAWLITQIKFAPQKEEAVSKMLPQTGWQSFVDGLRYLWHAPPILVFALLKATHSISYGGVDVVQVTFAEIYFPLNGDGSATLGLIYFAVGLGTGFGPIIARQITGDKPQAMYWGLVVSNIIALVGYLMLWSGTTLPMILIATVLRTMGSGINWVYSSSLLQLFVPSYLLGRVFAFDLAMMTLASTASTLWAGWARDSLGLTPNQISLWLGLVSVAVTIGWISYLTCYLQKQQIPTP